MSKLTTKAPASDIPMFVTSRVCRRAVVGSFSAEAASREQHNSGAQLYQLGHTLHHQDYYAQSTALAGPDTPATAPELVLRIQDH